MMHKVRLVIIGLTHISLNPHVMVIQLELIQTVELITIAQWSSPYLRDGKLLLKNDLIEVTNLTGSTTQLRVKNDISGSANSFDSDDRISVALTASEHGFETTKQFIDVDVRVAKNNFNDIIFSNTTSNLNTNGARPSNNLVTITFNDAESDTLNHDTFTFTDPSGQLTTVKSSDTYFVRPTSNLSGSTTYAITASIKDEHGFRTNTEEIHLQLHRPESDN